MSGAFLRLFSARRFSHTTVAVAVGQTPIRVSVSSDCSDFATFLCSIALEGRCRLSDLEPKHVDPQSSSEAKSESILDPTFRYTPSAETAPAQDVRPYSPRATTRRAGRRADARAASLADQALLARADRVGRFAYRRVGATRRRVPTTVSGERRHSANAVAWKLSPVRGSKATTPARSILTHARRNTNRNTNAQPYTPHAPEPRHRRDRSVEGRSRRSQEAFHRVRKRRASRTTRKPGERSSSPSAKRSPSTPPSRRRFSTLRSATPRGWRICSMKLRSSTRRSRRSSASWKGSIARRRAL